MNRRDFLKLSAAAATAATLPAALSSCSSSTAVTKHASTSPSSNLLKGKVVTSNFVTLNREYYLQWQQGAKNAVEALGGVYKWAVDDQNGPRQVQNFQHEVQQGAKIFFNAAPDPSTLAPIAQMAEQNQAYFTHFFEIPNWGSPFDPRLHPSKYFVTFFDVNLPLIGMSEVTELARAIGGKGNIVHITGIPGDTTDTLLTAGINAGLAKLPNIHIIGSQPGNYLEADSRTAMASLLRRYGRNIDGVIGQNEDCAIGAIQALTEAGKAGDIPVVTNGGTTLGTKYLLNGQLHATWALYPAWNAGIAAVRAIDASLGWKPTVPERMMLTGGSFITKDNAKAYLDYIQGPDPYDWPLMSRIAHPKDWDPQGPLQTLRLEDFWGSVPKPPGFVFPPEITKAEKAGDYDRVDAMYASHYKRKIFGDK